MTSLFLFIFVAYGLAFLLADASIFGCGAARFNDDPDDLEYINSKGILKIRPRLLRFKFFQELLGCYFCLGVWVGPIVHLLLYSTLKTKYLLFHNSTVFEWAANLIVAALFSATSCYAVDTCLDAVSRFNDFPPGPPLDIGPSEEGSVGYPKDPD